MPPNFAAYLFIFLANSFIWRAFCRTPLLNSILLMKRILLLLMCLPAFAAQAQDYGYLTFRTADGTEQSIAAAGLKITFADGKMLATAGTETLDIALSDLASMFFASERTGIDKVGADDAAALHWRVDEGGLHAAAADGDTMIRLYDASGKAVASGRGTLSAKLAKGIYVMKAAGQTIKVLAR